MSIEESIEKLENHIARLTGLSSATFVIEVELLFSSLHLQRYKVTKI